ncbi:MAG: family containing protein [Dehalococcoidia bacterium]|nr:family containing protein [Dehalococcoidia bacterium]
MLYELRVYDVIPGKLQALNDRFANITTGFFKKHGITVVGFWTDEVGASNRLTYMLAFKDLAHREQAWGAFQKDPDWARARVETERDGPMVARVHNTLMRPTGYSPMQ